MSVLLLLLMAYQVTGAALHEWIGIAMTLLVVCHQILNRKWYGKLFKGRYGAYRIVTTAVNILLLISFALTAFSGMSMSGHAVPFFYGMTSASLARKLHLSMSYWAFVLMGLHLGLHLRAMAGRLRLSRGGKAALCAAALCVTAAGLVLFFRSGIPDYLFFRAHFALLDYDKAAVLVLGENLLMLLSWACVGAGAALLCRRAEREKAARP